MRNRAEVPTQTRLDSHTYRLKIQLRDKKEQAKKRIKGSNFDYLRLIWHDYPGEWFEENVTSATEEQRRLETFRALLGSDVALLLVDGQKLLDHKGEESKYLKLLFTSYKNMLALLQSDLTVNGPLEEFPRIWIVALSKADLLPNLDAYDLRDLVYEEPANPRLLVVPRHAINPGSRPTEIQRKNTAHSQRVIPRMDTRMDI